MKISRLIVGPIFTNCYLISDNNEAALIDPGTADRKILDELAGSGAKLLYILNTHHHFDHITGDIEIKKITNAKILIHEKEKDYLDFPADVYLKDNDKIRIGNIELTVIRTPGHSAGSICLLGDNFIFTGDTLFADGYGRTDLVGGSDNEMSASLENLQEIIKPGMEVYPGHGDIYQA